MQYTKFLIHESLKSISKLIKSERDSEIKQKAPNNQQKTTQSAITNILKLSATRLKLKKKKNNNFVG